jgi:hypothetical protein
MSRGDELVDVDLVGDVLGVLDYTVWHGYLFGIGEDRSNTTSPV